MIPSAESLVRADRPRPIISPRLNAWICAWLSLFVTLPLFAANAPDIPTSPARSLTLADCILIALRQNHSLQIERLNPAIARDTLAASYGYYDPVFLADARRESLSDSGGFDPADFSRDAIYQADSQVARLSLAGILPSGMSYTFSGTYANSYGTRNFRNFDSYNLYTGVAIQQPLLKNFWIDQGRMTIKVNQRNLNITELGVVYQTMNVLNLVQQAYYELLFAHEAVKVQESLVASRERFLAGIQRQVENGMMAAPDEQLAQSQLAVAHAGLITSQNLLALAEHALKNLLSEGTHNAGASLVPADPLIVVPDVFNLQESWTRGLAERPDLAQLRQDLAKADIARKYWLNQLYPSLDLVAGYGRKGASTDQQPPSTFPMNTSRTSRVFRRKPGQRRVQPALQRRESQRFSRRDFFAASGSGQRARQLPGQPAG